jgi:hypothetical protein
VFNIGDKRSFSGAKRKKNLGKLRAEQFSFYPLLYESEARKAESAASPSETKWSGSSEPRPRIKVR